MIISFLLAILPGPGIYLAFAYFWRKERSFLHSTLWFAAVSGVHLFWLARTEYMGPLIWVVYLFCIVAIGVQFALLGRFLRAPLALAGCWTLFEWMRTYFLSGFTWNQVGLQLAASDYAIGFACLFGIYGLSFWVMLINGLVHNKKYALAATLALVPYMTGALLPEGEGETKKIALVQTDFLPDEIGEVPSPDADLVIYPEAIFREVLPPKQGVVIAGTAVRDKTGRYNSALYLDGKTTRRYDKRVLVPIGEYIPLSGWAPLKRFIAEQFGIYGFFTAGKEAKVFDGAGLAICLEETHPEMMRETRRAGAKFFVTLSNDVWFPNSDLPQKHLDQARVRAAENGVPLVRASNKGITAWIDSKGRVREKIEKAGVIVAEIPLKSHRTLYTLWGDAAILSVSLFCCCWKLRKRATFVPN